MGVKITKAYSLYFMLGFMIFCFWIDSNSLDCFLVSLVCHKEQAYYDGLLIRLEETGVGCHMGIRFIGALAVANDLNLLAPTLSGLKILIDVCEKYAKEFNIQFSGSKSRLLLFKGRNCRI